MGDWFPKQLPFEVHACFYPRMQGNVVMSEHRSIKAACRSLASVIRQSKGLESASIWCARDNKHYSLNLARELAADGYFDGVK